MQLRGIVEKEKKEKRGSLGLDNKLRVEVQIFMQVIFGFGRTHAATTQLDLTRRRPKIKPNEIHVRAIGVLQACHTTYLF